MLPVPHPAIIFQRIDDGAVLFSPVSELYFGLNEVGAKVWEMLPPRCSSLDQICTAIAAEYPDADPGMIRQDVEELLAQLLRDGLVAPSAATGAGGDTA